MTFLEANLNPVYLHDIINAIIHIYRGAEMSIGEQIKKFRTEKSITQEQLGELVGVSTQAVSKWERGGAPDIELLPALSQALGVSIDALFGNDDRSETLKLAHKLSRMSDKEAYRYAFGICWALEVGLRRDSSVIEDFIDLQIVNNPSKKENTEYFSKLLRDGGISTARISPDFRHFFLMVEPDGGIKNQLSSIETLRNVFAVFADEKLLTIIFYMYSRLNTPVAASLISHHTGIDEDEVERCMEILCQNNLDGYFPRLSPINRTHGETQRNRARISLFT